MRVETTLQLLGTKIIPSKKDTNRVYNTISFLDGVDAINIMTEDMGLFNNLVRLPQLTECKCEIDLNLGRYTSVRLVSCVPVGEKHTK